MKCIRFDVCKVDSDMRYEDIMTSSMKCIRFDVCKQHQRVTRRVLRHSSMKCIRFDVCKLITSLQIGHQTWILNEVHTF